MQRGRALVLVSATIAAAALLFPFFNATVVGSVRNGPHLLPAAALVVAALVAIAGDRGERLAGWPAIAATAAVTSAALVLGAVFIDSIIAKRDAVNLGLEASVGTGLWLTTMAVTLAAIGVGVAMSRRLS